MGKELGLDEAAQAGPVHQSENDTHDIEGTETVHVTVPKRSVDLKCIPNPFIPDTPCDTSVHDVLVPQPFQDSITTDPPTTQTVWSVSKKDITKDMNGTRVSRRQYSKTSGRLIDLGWGFGE